MYKILGALLTTSCAMAVGACGDNLKLTPNVDAAVVKCAIDETMPKVQLGGALALTVDPSAPLWSAGKEQLDLVAANINDNCGVLGGATGGVGVTFNIVDVQSGGPIATTGMTQLINQPVSGIIGVSGSATIVLTAPLAVAAHVPYFNIGGNADSMTGCAPNTTLIPTATPSDDPAYCYDHHGYVPRVNISQSQSIVVTSNYARNTWAANNVAVAICRDDVSGRAGAAKFASEFAAHGGTFAGSYFFANTITQANMVTQLRTALDTYNPSVVFGTYRIGHVIELLEAYVTLANDATYTKPSNFANLKFTTVSSVIGDYTPLSVAARTVAANQFVGIAQYYDSTSAGFKAWNSAWLAYNPDHAALADNHIVPRTYDGAFILALAIMKAGSTDGAAIAAAAPEVAGRLHVPGGDVIYPGEWKKARDAILAGRAINYQGASGSCDFDPTWQMADPVFETWKINIDGTTSLLDTVLGSR